MSKGFGPSDSGFMGCIMEPEKRIPVAFDVDVAVAGAGISGTFAALGAAKYGAKVVVVDRFGMPGGNMGPGTIVGYTVLRDELKVTLAGGQVPETINLFFDGLDGALDKMPRNYGTLSNVIPRLIMEMFERAGVELILSAYVSDPIMNGRCVRGFYMETKSGRVAVKSNVVVDATGDADIARRAGAPVRIGSSAMECDAPNVREEFKDPRYRTWNDGEIYLFIANADIEKYDRFRKSKCMLTDAQKQWMNERKQDPIPTPWEDALIPILQKGWETGEFKVIREISPNIYVHLYSRFERVETGIVGGRAGVRGEYDTGNFRDVSRIEAAVRSIAIDSIKFFSKHVPGFENAYILSSSPFLGARGGPFIEGEYILGPAESYSGLKASDTLYVTGVEVHRGANKRGHDMPYRMILPKNVDGLLVTGRGASFHRRGHEPSTRARGNMMGLGLATGIAAALSEKANLAPRELDIKALQRTLLAEGFYLGDDARLIELGLITSKDKIE